MTLSLDDSIPAPGQKRRGHFIARVLANVYPCREHNKLTFLVPGLPPSAPGQFVQVKCRTPDGTPMGDIHDQEHEWSVRGPAGTMGQPDLLRPTPILRRPFSIAGRRDTHRGAEIDLINRDVGPGTHWLHGLSAGDEVDLLGPLGNTFTLPGPGEVALLVGGGVGIPPMIYLAQALAKVNAPLAESQQRKAIAFCGALSLDLLPLKITDAAPAPPAGRTDAAAQAMQNISEFAECGFPTVVSTDDGTYGYHGRVTEPLTRYLDQFFPNTWEVGSRRPIIYTCGPEAMMKAVAAIALERGLRCQVAVERAMACGMGTCQSCVIRQKSSHQRGWAYRLACTDGPIFDASMLLW